MGKVGIEVIKAFIAAAPAYIATFWKLSRKPPRTLEEMQDCVDWDAEYEELLCETEKKKPKKSTKKRKARK